MQAIDWEGYRLANTNTVDAVNKIVSLSQQPAFRWVTTLNPQIVMTAESNPQLKTFIQNSDLIVPDGEGVVQAVSQETLVSLTKIAGVELVQALCKQPLSVYFLGAEQDVLNEAMTALSAANPDLVIAGGHHGFFDRDAWDHILAQIKAQNPDLILVGMGCPKQESVLMALSQALTQGVGIGVGGSFDVLSGRVRRAPKWCQTLRIEWFYRILRQPKKWRQLQVLWAFYRRYLRS